MEVVYVRRLESLSWQCVCVGKDQKAVARPSASAAKMDGGLPPKRGCRTTSVCFGSLCLRVGRVGVFAELVERAFCEAKTHRLGARASQGWEVLSCFSTIHTTTQSLTLHTPTHPDYIHRLLVQ